jgi:hypothetical protein
MPNHQIISLVQITTTISRLSQYSFDQMPLQRLNQLSLENDVTHHAKLSFVKRLYNHNNNLRSVKE